MKVCGTAVKKAEKGNVRTIKGNLDGIICALTGNVFLKLPQLTEVIEFQKFNGVT